MSADPRPCPICGAVDHRRLHRQEFAEGSLGRGYEVVICGRCGAGFANGIPSQAELDCYYAAQSKYEYAHSGGAESIYDLRRFELIAEQVSPYLGDKRAAVLDVGCATGGLLSCFQRRGFIQLTGSDPSEACAAAARELHGLRVLADPIEGLAGWKERFDAILLVGVLEHLREAGHCLKIVRGLLKPAGLIYCAQPDVEAFCDCTREPYQQFSTEHVNFLSRRSLDNLLAMAGLEPVNGWRWIVEWREGITDSVVSGLYRVADHRLQWQYDAVTEPALRAYLAQCADREAAELRPRFEALARQGIPVLVWGAGTLTRRLLAAGALAGVRIASFVDSNPHLRGTLLEGKPILAPQEIVGRREPILIGSYAFEREIADEIRKRLGMKNRIISLSGRTAEAGGP